MEIFILTVILVLIFLTFYSKQNFTNITFETDLEQRFKQMVDKIEKAKLLFAQLESGKRNVVEVARRNFEIQSRLTPQRI